MMNIHQLLVIILLLAISISYAVAVFNFPNAFYPALYPLHHHYSPNNALSNQQRLLSIYKSYNITVSKFTSTSILTKTVTTTSPYAATCTVSVAIACAAKRRRRGMLMLEHDGEESDEHLISPSTVQRMEMTQEPTFREGRAAAPQMYPHHPATNMQMMDFDDPPIRFPAGWNTHHHHHYYYNTPEIVSGFDGRNVVTDDPLFGLADVESGFDQDYYSSDCDHHDNNRAPQHYYNEQGRIPNNNNKGRHFFQNLSVIFAALRKTVTSTTTVTSTAISIYYSRSTPACYISYGSLPQCPNYGR